MVSRSQVVLFFFPFSLQDVRTMANVCSGKGYDFNEPWALASFARVFAIDILQFAYACEKNPMAKIENAKEDVCNMYYGCKWGGETPENASRKSKCTTCIRMSLILQSWVRLLKLFFWLFGAAVSLDNTLHAATPFFYWSKKKKFAWMQIELYWFCKTQK